MKKSPAQTNLAQFLKSGLDTWTGHISGREAVLQIMTIPSAVILAAIGMGIALYIAR